MPEDILSSKPSPRKIGPIEIPEDKSVHVQYNPNCHVDTIIEGLKDRGMKYAVREPGADYVLELTNHDVRGRGFTTGRFSRKPFDQYSAREKFIIVPTSEKSFETFVAQDLNMASDTDFYRKPDIVLEKGGKYCTGISGIDTVLEGGLLPGEINLLQIEPGDKTYYLILQALSSAHAIRMKKDPAKNGPNVKILSEGMAPKFVDGQFKRLLPPEYIKECIVPIWSKNGYATDALPEIADPSIVDVHSDTREKTPLYSTICHALQHQAVEKRVLIDGSIDTVESKKNSSALRNIAELLQKAKTNNWLTMFFGRNEEFLKEVAIRGGIDRYFHLMELADTGVLGIIDEYSRTKPLYVLHFDGEEYPITHAVKARKV